MLKSKALLILMSENFALFDALITYQRLNRPYMDSVGRFKNNTKINQAKKKS